VNVSNHVIAHTISDYYAQISGGAISAYSLNLTGSLSAGTGDVGDLMAANVTSGDLSALNTSTPMANIGTLRVTGNSTFHSPVSVDGALTVHGVSWLGNTDVSSLTSTGQSNVSGILFAQKNVQVTNSLTVQGNTRVFGDVTFNSSLVVGGNLTVHDQAQILHDLMVQHELSTQNLTVTGMANLASLQVSGWVNVTGTVRVSQDVNANNGRFGGSLMAHDGNVMENFSGKGSLTVGGFLSAVKLATLNGNLNVNTNENVQKFVTVDGTASFGKNLNVQGNLSAAANVTSGATFTAVDAMFDTLSVDAGTIQTLTSTFITSNNLVATDATIGNSFVSGMSTLGTLVVKASTTLTDSTANDMTGKTVEAGNATITNLEVTGNGQFVNVQVKTMITAGEPSRDTFFGAFENSFTDELKFGMLDGTRGNISDLMGESLTYTSIKGVNLMLKNLTAQTAVIQWADITNGTIETLTSNWTDIDWIWATTLEYDTLDAQNGWLTRVDAADIHSGWVNATQSWITNMTAMEITAEMLMGANATIPSLTASRDWTHNLWTTSGTIENLWSTTAWATNLHGNSITSDTGTVNQLQSTMGMTKTFDATESIRASWLWAKETNTNTLEAKSLRVDSTGMFQNVTLYQNLWVQNETTLQNGSLSSNTVLASLDVVSDADLLAGFSATETGFFTDLSVKRVTITDTFQANAADLGTATLGLFSVSNATTVNGFFNATKDSSLGGNLVVVGTTQFQTGSFTRIGTALITTTDMEAFNLNVAEGTFGDVTVGDFTANRAVQFERSISLAPLLGDISGATNSLFMQIAPTTFTATSQGTTFDVNTFSYLHTGNASIDALVVTTSSNASVAALRFKGDGSIDLMDGDVLFNDLNIQGGMVFENENNIAWPMKAATPNVSLAQGGSSAFYTYSQFQDRDLGAPGAAQNPTRFHAPTAATDLLTVTPGHYRVSGTVYFAPVGAVNTSLVAIGMASVGAWMGTQSNASSSPFWMASCVANFNLVPGSTWGGSCSFSDVLVVNKGETVTLCTAASWPFSSVPSAQMLTVTSRSTIQVAEYFERTSEGLSA